MESTNESFTDSCNSTLKYTYVQHPNGAFSKTNPTTRIIYIILERHPEY